MDINISRYIPIYYNIAHDKFTSILLVASPAAPTARPTSVPNGASNG